MKEFFDSCGSVAGVKIYMRNEQSRGFGYVEFRTLEAATNALLKDGSDLMGRSIRVNYSR